MTINYLLASPDATKPPTVIFNQVAPVLPVPSIGDEIEVVDRILSVYKIRWNPLANAVNVYLNV